MKIETLIGMLLVGIFTLAYGYALCWSFSVAWTVKTACASLLIGFPIAIRVMTKD